MNCLFCGYHIPNGATVCAHCHAERNSEVEEESSTFGQRIGYAFYGGILGPTLIFIINKLEINDVEAPLWLGLFMVFYGFFFFGRWFTKYKIWWVRNGESRIQPND